MSIARRSSWAWHDRDRLDDWLQRHDHSWLHDVLDGTHVGWRAQRALRWWDQEHDSEATTSTVHVVTETPVVDNAIPPLSMQPELTRLSSKTVIAGSSTGSSDSPIARPAGPTSPPSTPSDTVDLTISRPVGSTVSPSTPFDAVELPVSRPAEPSTPILAPADGEIVVQTPIPPMSVQPELTNLTTKTVVAGSAVDTSEVTISRPAQAEPDGDASIVPTNAIPPMSVQPELTNLPNSKVSVGTSTSQGDEIAREGTGFTSAPNDGGGTNAIDGPGGGVTEAPVAAIDVPNGDYAPAAGFSSAEVAAQAATFTAALKGGAYAKLDTQLAALAFEASAQAAAVAGITSTIEHRGLSADRGSVLVDVGARDGDGAALLATLQQLGLQEGSSFGGMVSGYLPVSQLATLASLQSVATAKESGFSTNVGLVTTQDDVALAASTARTNTGFTGAGVTVGVLSDSFATRVGPLTTMAQDITNGDLPASTTVLEDFAGGTDEGRGMAQLIHDLAPGSPIQFATAFTGQAGFANNIVDLWNAGSKVIVDDVFYFAEPAYQDGVIAQAVDQVVNAGAVYFSSAGNQGRLGYESAFVNSGVAGPPGSGTLLHDWQTTAGGQTLLPITVGNGSSIRLTLHWDQSSASVGGPGASNDVDLFLYNSAGTLVAQSVAGNVGGDPFEFIGFTNNTGSSSMFVSVGLFSGAAPAAMKLLMYGGSAMGASDRNTNDGTVSGHAAARGAVAVAAAPWFNTPAFMVSPPVIESFSSGGPTNIWYTTAGARLAAAELRQTAEITASDGGNTTFFGSDIGTDADTFPNFFGTSAAAPNAAAVAALMLQARSTLTAEDILNLQKSSATDMDNPATGGFDTGFDTRTGQGLVQADLAVAFAQTLNITGSTNRTQLFGTHFADVITGSSAGDVLSGYDGNDRFTGGASADNVIGGNGLDTSIYSEASGSATWTYNADGHWTVTTPAGAVDQLFSTEMLQFSDRPLRLWRLEGEDLAGDFNGDGRDDTLFRNSSSGMETWQTAANGSVTSVQTLGESGNAWMVAGVGNFNAGAGSLTDDILLRNETTGTLAFWSMNGTPVGAGTVALPLDWHVHAVSDFNGDNTSDLLLRNATSNDLVVWTMNNFGVASGAAVATVTGTWRLLGTGDFNGDNRDDMLWYNSANNALSTWQMNGALQTGGGVLGTLDSTWAVQGIADFNGDGRDDILWRHNSGALAQWQMNGAAVSNSAVFSSLTSDWQIQNVGQFDTGTTADMLLRNTNSGAVVLWQVNNLSVTGSVVQGGAPSDWWVM